MRVHRQMFTLNRKCLLCQKMQQFSRMGVLDMVITRLRGSDWRSKRVYICWSNGRTLDCVCAIQLFVRPCCFIIFFIQSLLDRYPVIIQSLFSRCSASTHSLSGVKVKN